MFLNLIHSRILLDKVLKPENPSYLGRNLTFVQDGPAHLKKMTILNKRVPGVSQISTFQRAILNCAGLQFKYS